MAATLAPRGTLESVVGANGFLFALVVTVIVAALASWRLARYEIRAAE